MPVNALIFDIETIADLTPDTYDAVAALAKGREMVPEHYGALCPPLARVVCIAWFDLAGERLGAAFDATLATGTSPLSLAVPDGQGISERQLECTLQVCAGEAQLLSAFGRVVEQHCQQPKPHLVTFNGRGFDLPVLVHRSVKHGVTPGRTILLKAARENRFNPALHTDLMETVTFFGASGRWPMAAYAIGYGFASPKQAMSGAEVGPAVQAGRILDVVRYCAGDVLATAHVFRRFIA